MGKYTICPYCGNKTLYLVIGNLDASSGDEVRCYSCKREWKTNFALPEKEPECEHRNTVAINDTIECKDCGNWL